MANLNGMSPPAPPQRKVAAAMPRLEPSPNFLYKHHPEQWCVLEGRLVPSLGKLILRPGTSRVASNGDPSDAITEATRRGWTVIDRDVDGEGTNYVKAHRVKAKYDHNEPDYVAEKCVHLDQFAKVFPNSNIIRSGGEEYSKWAASLVDRGIIAPCPSHVIERLIEAHSRTASTFRAKVGKNPENEGRAEVIEGRLKVLRAELKKALKREGA